MNRMRLLAGLTIAGMMAIRGFCASEMARVEDSRFELRMFAEQPEIWTPTGVAVDQNGRVFVIESHTHLPKAQYPGPKRDRIKVFVDRDNDGKADAHSIFAEDLLWAMNLEFAPNGDLFVAQRNEVLLLRDRDGDGKADSPDTILKLETPGDYPHNGLDGLAIGPDGWMYAGMGENLGFTFTLKGKDKSISGDEGGHIFRCRLDGSRLERFATGFWNPYSLGFDGAGNLFAVDNDPDGRPPCRLLHVIRGGDYGYKFKYGRSGLHPFVAWNGELPGTLPMVAGTGEAPSGLLWCSRLGWPEEFSNSFVGTSWGDNLVETFPLEPRGASFKAERKTLVRGDPSFRPVAMAAAPNGVLYMTDWADREYSVHQKGRIWRLAHRGQFQDAKGSTNPETAKLREIAQLPAKAATLSKAVDGLLEFAVSNDPFVRAAAVNELAALHPEALLPKRTSREPKERLAVLLALRQQDYRSPLTLLKRALQDEDDSVRQTGMIWAAERGLTELKEELLESVLKSPRTLPLLQTYLGAEQILSGYKKNSVWEQGPSGADLVAALLKDESKPAELGALAMELKNAPQARPVVGAPVAEPARRPQTEGEWLAAIGFGGEPEAGRKLFFSERVGCAKCHKVQGEGGNAGPDLGVIARASDRAKLVNSILQPSANIGPLYLTHEIKTRSGDEYTGLLAPRSAEGKITIINSDAKQFEIPADQVVSDRTSVLSLMPAGLEAGLSVREFADLISFLQTLR